MDETFESTQLGHNLARFDTRSKVRDLVNTDEVRVTRAPAKEKAASINAKPMVVFMYFIFVILLIVFSYAKLSEINSQNTALNNKLNTLRKEQRILTAQMESQIKLDEIAEVAYAMGMVKPDNQQVVYLNMSGPEKVEILNKKSGLDRATEFVLTIWEDMQAYFQ